MKNYYEYKYYRKPKGYTLRRRKKAAERMEKILEKLLGAGMIISGAICLILEEGTPGVFFIFTGIIAMMTD